ncbi:MAG: amidohydrolase family protein [Sterolibacterium sp.]
MLIRDVEIPFATKVDVRINAERISEIGAHLKPRRGEPVIEGHGGALFPGLHDHHIHLISLAASLESVQCGPPHVMHAEELAQRLLERAARRPARNDWIRGVGYHESVAGEIDRTWLDRIIPAAPVRIQHRSGRLWILNSCALGRIQADVTDLGRDPLERIDGYVTGRIFDGDAWLRERLPGELRSLRAVSELLAGFGVTGVTDVTPHNDLEHYRHFAREQARGALLQDVAVMGNSALDAVASGDGLARGATKLYLRENTLPPLEAFCEAIQHSHASRRPVAIHCVTIPELVFALGALNASGSSPGDRIEHAALAPPETLGLIRSLGVSIVTQPGFVRERGDAYLRDVPAEDIPWLYRLKGLIDAGIPVGGSTDAPFGNPNPWLAMEAAVRRTTLAGKVLGASEAVTPESAIALFTGSADAPGAPCLQIRPGDKADLCLLDQAWTSARQHLGDARVVITIKEGKVIWPQRLA